jgi:hypothetical protein
MGHFAAGGGVEPPLSVPEFYIGFVYCVYTVHGVYLCLRFMDFDVHILSIVSIVSMGVAPRLHHEQ